jgi:hypothetical protein
MQLQDEVERAKKLFLEFSDNFELEFDHQNKFYKLKTKKCFKLHPLESCLLGYGNLTGSKIIDICRQIKKNSKWVLGFFDSYKSKKISFKNAAYLEGYEAGLIIKNKLQ